MARRYRAVGHPLENASKGAGRGSIRPADSIRGPATRHQARRRDRQGGRGCPAMTSSQPPTIEEVTGWVRLLSDHGGAVEVRSLGGGPARSKVFPPGTAPREVAVHALAEDEKR